MRLNTFHNMFVDQLRDIYSAERQIVDALPKMAEAASSTELQNAFEQHLEQSKGHIERLQRIFEQLDERPGGITCKAMEALIEEGSEIVEKRGEPHVKDAALIAAAQRVEHYEITSYGTTRTFAKHLNMNDVADMLQKTLDEESKTNEKLTKLAEGSSFREGINQEAVESS